MKAAVLVLLMASAAHAQPMCDQCAPLDAGKTFITWTGTLLSNAPITFSVQTVNGVSSCLIYQRAWSFGDGTTGTADMPTHLFERPGIYNVSVTMTTYGGCNPPQSFGVSIPVTVTTCDACPQLGPANTYIRSECPSSTCAFTVETLGASLGCSTQMFQWDFGDGTTSNQLAVSHTYKSAGTYNVSVTVSGLDPCSPTFTIQQAVTVKGRRRSCCR